MKKEIFITLLIFWIFFSFQTRAETLPSVEASISDMTAEAAGLEKKKEALSKEVSNCFETFRSIKKSCQTERENGTFNLNKPYDQLRTEFKALEQRLKVVRDNIVRKLLAEKDANKIVAINKYTRDVDGLLTTKKQMDRDLKLVGIDIKAMYLKMDQTVLGNYARYVASGVASSPQMQETICKTVSSCAELNQVKGSLKQSQESLDTFESHKSALQK